jgi:crossover junction endodeoxyribonuclease RuvC
MIIGIDPGVNIVGFALVQGSKSNPVIVDYGILHTDQTTRNDGHFRLLEIAQDMEAIITKYKPTKAIVEDLFFFKNAKTVIQVAQSRGVILYILAKNNVEIISKTPLQIKQTITGYGRADKKQMQQMVKKIYKLKEIPQPDDAADALAMAWIGL